ncbi:MAG: glycosyltransferase [Candidatus Aminicenantes bacterium]|nr:glycosyltransferase [Candidatus Aminicenantes bacterium]
MSNKKYLPKISVIIPLYNQKDYISEAINSVLEQTYENIEIIVINDGSTDDPGIVLEKYKNKITVINQDNAGLSSARNTGIKNSTGVYLQFLDADDILVEEKIEKQISSLLQNKEDLSYCKIEVLNDIDNSISSRITYEFDDIFSHYYLFWKPYPTPIHSLIFNRKIFDKYGLFDEDLKANEDRFYLAKLSYSGVKFRYIPFVGGYYRKHSESMNADPEFIITSTIKFYLKINKVVGEKYIFDSFGYSGYQMMCANCTFYYFIQIRNGIKGEILKNIKKVLRENGIIFFVEPLDSRFKKNKFRKMLLACYFERYTNIFRSFFNLSGNFNLFQRKK